MSTKSLTVLQKIFEVQKVCDFFKKDTTGHNYKYASGTQVLTAVRSKMDEIKLLLEPHLSGDLILEGTQYAQTGFMVWVDVETGEERKIPWTFAGKQQDISKAFGSALTYCQRYFILKYFNVPTDEDDPDKRQQEQTKTAQTGQTTGKTDLYTTYRFKSGEMEGKSFPEINNLKWLEYIATGSKMAQVFKDCARKRVNELSREVPASTKGIKETLQQKESTPALKESDFDFGDNN